MNCKWTSKENEQIKCHRQATSSGYCIFHKQNKSPRERALFDIYIKKGEINDFTGFYFEDEFNIDKKVDYTYGKLKFNEAVFEKNANFKNFIFKNTVDFTNAEFKSHIDFSNSTFLKNCIFNNTTFNPKYINEQIFQNTDFNGQKLIVEKCDYFPRLDGIEFSPYSKFIFKDIDYNEKNSICGKTNYKIARIQAKQTEDSENIGYYYYNERKYTSNFLKNTKYKGYKDYLAKDYFDFLSKYLVGYGQKPLRLLYISFFIISFFALIYMFTGINTLEYGLIKIDLFNNIYTFKEIIICYIEAWYFSMITFSTVGYGDITAFGILGKGLICVEIFVGTTIHATWTSVLFARLID